jgi:hypothetical protein
MTIFGLARLEISKIHACCHGSMRRKTTSLTVLPVAEIVKVDLMNIDIVPILPKGGLL